MKTNRIKLTESQLRNMIAEAINEISTDLLKCECNELIFKKMVSEAVEAALFEYKNSEMGWKGQLMKGYTKDAHDAIYRQYSGNKDYEYNNKNGNQYSGYYKGANYSDPKYAAAGNNYHSEPTENGNTLRTDLTYGITPQGGRVEMNHNFSPNMGNAAANFGNQKNNTDVISFQKGGKPSVSRSGYEYGNVPRTSQAQTMGNTANKISADMNDYYSGNYEKRMAQKRQQMMDKGMVSVR